MELKTIGLTKKFGSKTAVDNLNITLTTVSYTHLDVYKRQPPHKDHVVVGGILVNISGGDEEVYQRGTEFPFLCQIVQDVGVGDVP